MDNQSKFIQAIHDKQKIKATFFSKKDQQETTRLCAPMDYGPSRRAKDKQDRYHVWDYEGSDRQHVTSLLPEQVFEINVTDESFNPEEFIDWDVKESPWFIKRDWGIHS